MSKKGFTLIELLVSISIISLLAAVTYGYLKSTKDRGADAAVMTDMSGFRPEMELYFINNGGTYVGACDSSKVQLFRSSILDKIKTAPLCDTSATEWAFEADLRAAGYFCVDYTAKATTSAVSKETLGVGSTRCP